MKKYQILTILVAVITTSLSSQNELYIKGNNGTNPTLFIKGNDNVNPSLFVDGDIINDQGIFQNSDGAIELTGTWTNTVTSPAKYESTGEEKFSNTTNSTISGTMNGTTNGTLNSVTSGINQFYHLKVDLNDNSEELLLNVDVNIHNNGTLEFVSDGIITTGTNDITLRNNSSGSISGYTFPISNIAIGSNTRYINGNLTRNINTGIYEFPIGDNSNMIPVKLSNVTANAYIKASAQTGALAPNYSGYLYADVATHPGSGTGYTLADAIANTPDGTIDQLQINLNSAKEWQVDLSSGSVTSYDIEVYPGLHDVSGVYNSSNGDLRYLLKDGATYDPLGNILTTNSYPGIGFSNTGYDGAIPTTNGYKMTSLNSFSTFRLGGVSPSGGLLPVELVYLEANPIKNEYIQVAWQTETEINNEAFEIQRSVDGLFYEKIATIKGQGTTNETKNYSFDDHGVKTNTIYYYRLKQIDFDGNFDITYSVNAYLRSKEFISISPFIPNPSKGLSQIKIESNLDGSVNYVITDAIGKLILKNTMEITKGMNTLPIDLTHLSSGIYHTKITINEENYFRKMNVIK